MSSPWDLNQMDRDAYYDYLKKYERTHIARLGKYIITTLSFYTGNSDVDYTLVYKDYDYLSERVASSYGFSTRGESDIINQSGFEPDWALCAFCEEQIEFCSCLSCYERNYFNFSETDFYEYVHIQRQLTVYSDSNSEFDLYSYCSSNYSTEVDYCAYDDFSYDSDYTTNQSGYEDMCVKYLVDIGVERINISLAIYQLLLSIPQFCFGHCMTIFIIYIFSGKCVYFDYIHNYRQLVTLCVTNVMSSWRWFAILMSLKTFIYYFLQKRICDGLKNQSGVEDIVHGEMEVRLWVPVSDWDRRYDGIVHYNIKKQLGQYICRQYNCDLTITISVYSGTPHVVIQTTLDQDISHDRIIEFFAKEYNTFLAGLYMSCFDLPHVHVFWEWLVFENQSGRESKKNSKKEHNRRLSKKEKKECVQSLAELPDYIELRRSVLNLEKLVVDPLQIDSLTAINVKKRFLKMTRLVQEAANSRTRIDLRLNLPISNQAGDESCFYSIDDIFGNDNQFTRAIATCINMNRSDMTPGDSAKLLLQISLWSYEIVTAESLMALVRKITLMGTYVFPDSCSTLLENLIKLVVPDTTNQAGLQTFAGWTKELHKMWASQDTALVGNLKKFALVLATASVFSSQLESFTPLEVMKFIIQPSKEEVDKLSPKDVISYFLECLKYLTQASADAWRYGDLLAFFRLRDPTMMVSEEMVEVMDKYHRLHTYGLSMLDITVEELRQRCIKLKDDLKACQGHPKLGGLVSVRTMFSNLNKIISECDAGFKQKPLNETPFGMVAFGPPETGKSGVITKAWQAIAINNGYDCAPRSTCHINPSDKFQSTADGQYHVHLDDINQALGTKPDSINNSMLLLRMINQVPWFTNQAEIDKKGTSVLCPKVVTVTSQTQHMYSYEDVHEPSAIARRIALFVEVRVKPKYATAGGSINHEALDGSDEIHELTVTRPIPVGLTNDGKQIIRYQYVDFDFEDGNGPIALVKITLKQFCYVAVVLYKKHMNRESEQLQRIIDITACEHQMPKGCCVKCMTNQSEDADLVLQKSLIGKFAPDPPRSKKKSYSPRHADDAIYAAELASQEEESLENQFGFDLALLYRLALFVPHYLFHLPWMEVRTGAWTNVRCWYGNYVSSQYIEKKFGLNFKLMLPSFIWSLFSVGPIYLLAEYLSMLWILPVCFTSFLCVPFVAYDIFCHKIREWKVDKLLAFESSMRHLVWLKARKNQIKAGMIVILTSVVTFVAYKLFYVKEEKGLPNNGGVYSDLCSKMATKKPEGWERDIHITDYLRNSANITRQQLIGTVTEPGLILNRTAYCVNVMKRSTNAFPICGNYWILPYHYLQESTERVNFYFAGAVSNGSRFGWTPGPEGVQWIQIPGHDLALCHVPDLPPQKDMRPLLTDSCILPQSGMLLYKNMTDGEIAMHTIPVLFNGKCMSVSSDDATVVYESAAYVLIGSKARGGMCMSPVIGDTKHPTILGFHTKGGEEKGRADILSLTALNACLEQLIRKPMTTRPVCSDAMKMVGGVEVEIAHPKHVGRFVEETEGITFLGSAKGITRRKPKMNTTKTPIHEAVCNQFGVEGSKWHAPPVNPPWLAHHNMLENLREPATPDPALVERAMLDYQQQLDEHFVSHEGSLKDIRKMSLDEALKGIPGVPGYEALNMSTSKGHVGVLFDGYTNGGKKTEVLDVRYVDDEGKQCFDVVCPQKLLDELEELDEQAAGLQRIGCVAALNHKDETLKAHKECARLFSALPLHFILLQRMYFLSFTKWFRDWNFVSECAVGINAHSPLWNTFGEYMKVHEYNIAGDYKAFDQKSIALFLICCYNIIMHISQLAGFSERDLNVMSSLVMDLIYPIFDFNSDLVMSNGGNPSGHSLTVIINSIMNSLYMRYVFFKCLPHLIKFQAFVKLLTYGDDNIMSVSAFIKAFFNQNTISKCLADIGIVYTDAHKNTKFDDFVPFEDMTFLKRSFVFREEFCGFVGPIEKESLFKSLLYHVPSKAEGVLVENQMSQTLISASDECFLYGKDEFESFQLKLRCIVKDYGISHLMHERFYFDYEQRLENWKEKYGEEKFVLINQSGFEMEENVSHGVRVRASSIRSGFFNQNLPRSIGYLIYILAVLLPNIVMALNVCKIMQLGRFVDSQYLSERNWVTEMNMKTGSRNLQENLDFADGTPQPIVSYNNRMAAETMAMSTGDMTLGNFFARPILIQTISWTPDLASFGTTFNPWTNFFGNKRVINRINNYNLLSANLHLKAVINGNGFYYGRAMMDYIPLYNYDNVSQINLLNKTTLVAASQRLHLQIDPTTSSGGEMILPFIWPRDKLSIPSAEWEDMGMIYVREMNLLKHANAGTTPIEINIYAWAENVELSIPTSTNSSALVNQSGDEYGTSKFDDIATALIDKTDALSSVPAIGAYMQASSMAMRGMRTLTRLAGFSRPPDPDSIPVRRVNISNLVNVDAADGSVKLSVDSKQELSVGSEAVNLSVGDELDIATICSKQSYLAGGFWDLTHGVGDPLFYGKVSPVLFATESTPVNFFPTPMMYASLPFRFWRGKLKFRFQVVASSFHRGRLLITWNPTTVPSKEENVVCSTIMDLDKSRECVLEVPWGNPASFLNVETPTLAQKGWLVNPGGSSLTINNLYDNGVVGVYVLNTLAVPNTSATALVGLNVYVSMEEAQFAVPDDTVISGMVMSNQSGIEPDIEVPMPIDDNTTRKMEETDSTDTLMLMYHGERITNFRALLKRYCYHMSSNTNTVTALSYRAYFRTQFPAFPAYQGTRTGGFYTGVNICRTTFLNYLTPCFLAQRGGIRVKSIFTHNGTTAAPIFTWTMRRSRTQSYSNTYTSTTAQPTEASMNAESINLYVGAGANITQTNFQPNQEIEVPFQRNERFAVAKNVSNFTTFAPVAECISSEAVGYTNATGCFSFAHMVAAAEDFNLLLWQSAPAFTLVAV